MAVEGEAKEYRAHWNSYGRFLFMMKWGAIVSVITGFVVILLIAQ